MIVKNINNREVAILGAGVEGEKFLYFLEDSGYKVEKVFDNYKEGEFHGKVIDKLPQYDELKKYFIFVSSKDYYEQLREQLEEMGLEEYKDFSYCYEGIKKVVIINMNCYGSIITQFLNSSKLFKKTYYIHKIPLIQENEDGYISENLLKHCDVYIHQDIREDNKFGYRLSDDYINKKLKTECINITVPNLVGFGKIFYPQGAWNDIRNDRKKYKDGLFPYSDKRIDDLLLKKMGEREIIQDILTNNYYNNNYIVDNFNSIVKKFRIREENWDVKIIDYILSNYQKKQMFYDINHPVNEIIEVIAREVLKILNIDDDNIYCKSNLGNYEMYMYPEVKKTLKLEYDIKEIRKKSPHKLSDTMGLYEYVKQYIFWCRN